MDIGNHEVHPTQGPRSGHGKYAVKGRPTLGSSKIRNAKAPVLVHRVREPEPFAPDYPVAMCLWVVSLGRLTEETLEIVPLHRDRHAGESITTRALSSPEPEMSALSRRDTAA